MKLAVFNPQNTMPERYQGRKEPLISFNQKSGLFRINECACSLLKLKAGLRIEFAQDKDKLENWYVYIGKTTGFELYSKKTVTSGLYFSNAKMAQLIAGSLQYHKEAGKIFIRKQSLRHQAKVIWFLDISPLKAAK